MIPWKLKVKEYGKIKAAEVEVAPLTLFVGDNNSGKSYLLSLLWGIQNYEISEMIRENDMDNSEAEKLRQWLSDQISIAFEKQNYEVDLEDIKPLLEIVLNESLDKRKNELVKWIFNNEDIKIGHLSVEMGEFSGIKLIINVNENTNDLTMKIGELYRVRVTGNIAQELRSGPSGFFIWILIQDIYRGLLEIGGSNVNGDESHIYLPAARTGFMLTKDIINKMGRQNTFNIQEEKAEIAPFVRPINQFLNIMTGLSLEREGNQKCVEILKRLELEMTGGSVDINNMPAREVAYIPRGKRKGLPLRMVSAVVTELSPLILMLKHKSAISKLYYEEPEMCLHPQLQHSMGRIVVQLVNAGIDMVVTTHSDIILQHINNMIKLSTRGDCENLCERFGYTSDDLLHVNQVKVYQFTDTGRGKSQIEELKCGENGFTVPTFNDALDTIMDEAYEIQG